MVLAPEPEPDLCPVGKPLLELGHNDCRYVLGDPRNMMFCGKRVVAFDQPTVAIGANQLSWCLEHAHKVFVKKP